MGADVDAILALGEKGFKEITLFDDYADKLLASDAYRKQLGLYVNTITLLYDSAKPEIYDHPELRKARDVFEYLHKVVERQVEGDEQIEKAKKRIDDLLDTSILGKGDLRESTEKYIINTATQVDLTKLNFDLLRQQFPQKTHKHIQFADLRELMEIKLKQMLAQNKTRGSFLARFQQIIDDYNSGSKTIEEAYEALMKEAQDLSEEQERAVREDLTEAQLEIYDLLRKDKLTKAEEKTVKLAAKELLTKLTDARSRILVQEWHREKAAQERVKREIQLILNAHLPESYDREIFTQKTDLVFRHFYEQAEQGTGFAA